MDDTVKKEILARLRSIEGHVRGIARMVEEDVYCVDIMRQTIAAQKALEKVNTLLMDNHLHTCVTRALQSSDPQERERVIDEIVDVFTVKG
jgi:DNA-binding FrmR family transcriptional regulator